jgi:thioesterase domain-containing protein
LRPPLILQRQGEKVSLLALVDSEAPGFGLRGWLRLLSGAARSGDWRFAQERIYQACLHPAGLRRLRRLRGLGETHRWALWSYRPGCYNGRALLIRPSGLPEDLGPALGWERLIGQGLVVRTLPGEHGDLVKEPGVRSLAAELGPWLG